jgi:putative tryptophan/tyrosine transport system substrate-binding protein
MAFGVEPHFEEVAEPGEIEAAFGRFNDGRCQAVVVVDGPIVNSAAKTVANTALRQGMPTVSTLRFFVEAGSLAAYGPNVNMMYHRAAYFVDRILKGVPPRDLPVEQPNAFELVINQRTARALRLTLSAALVARADEVIE